jgi:hypothetical protein
MTIFSELMASQNSMEQETPSHSITKFVLATSSSYQPAPPPTRYIWWCGHLANRCSHTASRSPSGLPTAFFAVHQLQRTANLFAVHPINGVPQNGVPQMPDCRAIRCRRFLLCAEAKYAQQCHYRAFFAFCLVFSCIGERRGCLKIVSLEM